ncbi:MAG: hypothetical protein K2M34_04970 [Alphaproteobacteria bacterium]|nr:hypothetical protein [Alphaproteobacteria bacterium]
MKTITFIADGQTKIFHFTFPFFLKSDVIIEVDGQPATNYNLLCIKNGLNADVPFSGGAVQFTKPPKQPSVITIQRKLPIKRLVDYQITAPYSPITHNQDMNYIIEILKDMQDAVESALPMSPDAANKDAIDNISEQITQIMATIEELRIAIEQPDASVDLSQIYSRLSDLETTVTALSVSISQLADQVQNINIPTLPDNMDYVIESQMPTAENNYTWYRKYASGWVEQGGTVSTANDTYVTITLPIKMQDANYQVQKTGIGESIGIDASYRSFCVTNRTISTFKTFAQSMSTGGFMWYVYGVAKQ